MNHRPFETWLLNEQPLTPEEKRDLQVHLQDCPHCTALAEVNLELHSVKMAAPADGFTARFQKRLAEQRVRERRNRLVGVSILATGGLGLTAWYAAPYVVEFVGSPAEWISAGVNFNLLLGLGVHAVVDWGKVSSKLDPATPSSLTWGIGAHFNFHMPMM